MKPTWENTIVGIYLAIEGYAIAWCYVEHNWKWMGAGIGVAIWMIVDYIKSDVSRKKKAN